MHTSTESTTDVQRENWPILHEDTETKLRAWRETFTQSEDLETQNTDWPLPGACASQGQPSWTGAGRAHTRSTRWCILAHRSEAQTCQGVASSARSCTESSRTGGRYASRSLHLPTEGSKCVDKRWSDWLLRCFMPSPTHCVCGVAYKRDAN